MHRKLIFILIMITVNPLDLQVNQVDCSVFQNSLTTEITSVVSNNNITLNCFGLPNGVFANIFESMFTQATNAEDVRFYFHSREENENTTIHAKDDFHLKNLSFNIDKNTFILVHGFMSNGRVDWLTDMKDVLLKLGDFNVIIVDWQKGSNTWNYYSASISTKIVGTEIAKLLQKIKSQARKLWPKKKNFGLLHFVGHSLGAHISSYASYKIKNDVSEDVNWVIHRITGLDPAQPCFSEADPSLKLDKSDALFVDVIHTNARNILLLGLGLPGQLGHMDFYPNGGQIQIGCDPDDASFWSFLMLPVDIIKEAICSHGRSHDFFTDSIRVRISQECTYVGHKWNRTYDHLDELVSNDCEDICSEMGINAINYHPNEDETFFVPTGDSEPFCAVTNEDKVHIKQRLQNDKATSKNVLHGYVEKIF